MTPFWPAHFYATGDPVPQLVRVQNGFVWLPDNGKLVAVDKLEGKLIRLVEVSEPAPVQDGEVTDAP